MLEMRKHQNINLNCAQATAVHVVFIPVCRKCVYIDEANQGIKSFQDKI